MFERTTRRPEAVASHDEDGVNAAIAWCLEHLGEDETLTVWTHLKSNLRNNAVLEELTRYRNVEHITRRGGSGLRSRGPVLMAWADMDDIADLLRFGAHHVTALAVISWNEEALRPWVGIVEPEVLGDSTLWVDLTVDLHPVVVAALEDLTVSINHNNTLGGGYEKDDVVSTLLALHAAGIPMRGAFMQAWALAHGWAGDNPRLLAEYARDISKGKRPRSRNVLNPGYVDDLRQRICGSNASES